MREEKNLRLTIKTKIETNRAIKKMCHPPITQQITPITKLNDRISNKILIEQKKETPLTNNLNPVPQTQQQSDLNLSLSLTPTNKKLITHRMQLGWSAG